jgi:predicted nucleotidyltransferase
VSTQDIFATRSRESQQRLEALRTDLSTRVGSVERRFEDPEVCIYATGSLAREEATQHSDLDAFFLLSGHRAEKRLGRIRDVKILSAVVKAAEEASFPDFSNDGEFLRFMHIGDIIDHIGSRHEDYHNMFTARMLMILESRYLYNQDAYRRFRGNIISAYFRDFHDHSKNFRPVFLLNDILRFWRTLCINYEHARQWRENNSERAAKGHLGNLKLRFSRLCICYSFIAYLLSRGATLSADDVTETAELTPLDRLRALGENDPELNESVGRLLDKYAWFLEHVGQDKETVLHWIANQDNRDAAFAESAAFVEGMVSLVQRAAEKNGYLRYLII